MKEFITIIFCIIFSLSGLSQTAPKLEWAKCYGGSRGQEGNCIKQTKDGGFINIGTTNSCDGDITKCYTADGSYSDIWVTKIDKSGNIEWQKTYGGTKSEGAYCISETNDNGYIFTGVTNSNDGDVKGLHVNTYNGDAWVVKLDHFGNIEWQKCIGGSQQDWGSSIIQINNGDYIMAGHTTSFDGDIIGRTGYPGNEDFWLVDIKPNGDIRWGKTYGGDGDEYFGGMITTKDNGFILCGLATSNDGDVSGNHGRADGWVVKVNDTGKIEWQNCYGGSYSDVITGIVETKKGDYMLIGQTNSNDGDINGQNKFFPTNQGAVWALKINDTGSIIWQKCYGGSGNNTGICIIALLNGDFILGSDTNSNDGDVSNNHNSPLGSLYDIWFTRINDTGTIVWQKCYGGSSRELLNFMTITNDGGFIATGYTESNDGDVVQRYKSQGAIWILKLKFDEVINITNTNGDILIYPNPAHDFVGIQTDNIKEIRILDVAGRQYLHRTINAAENIYTYFNLQYLARGVYIIQTIGNDGSIKVGELMVE